MNYYGYGAYTAVGFLLLLELLLIALAVVMYVFTGISLYQIGKRRGVRCYGLAWVPIGNVWLIGALGDQYEGIRTGKRQSLRWWILGLLGGAVGLSMILMAVSVVLTSRIYAYGGMMSPDHVMQLGGIAFGVILLFLLLAAAAIAGDVLAYISLYRVYRSTKPQNAVVFLVLSIVFSVTMPFFLFACRKYDAPIEMIRNPIPPQYNAQLPMNSDTPADPKNSNEE